MRLHNFFLKQKIGDSAKIAVAEKEILHQWIKVFRMKAGDSVILFDNSGDEFVSRIELLLEDNEAVLEIIERRRNENIPAKKVHLFQSFVKKDKFEWICEKATELGVSAIRPVLSERSEKKDMNRDRLERIIKEAAEQSGRGVLPVLNEVVGLEKALSSLEGTAIAFHLEGEKFNAKNFLKPEIISIFIGPEGGWSPTEIKMFQEKNIPLFSFGRQILRSETAAVAATALVLLG